MERFNPSSLQKFLAYVERGRLRRPAFWWKAAMVLCFILLLFHLYNLRQIALASSLTSPLFYVVSMQEERYLEMKTKLMASGVDESLIHRLPGVNGSALNLEQLTHDGFLSYGAYLSAINQRSVVGGHYMTPGALGCYMSHVAVWQDANRLNRSIMVFEDDVHISSNFLFELKRSMADLPSRWHLFYPASIINTAEVRRVTRSYSRRLYQVYGQMWGTYAYMISPEGAAKLLGIPYPAQHQIDSYMIAQRDRLGLAVFRNKWNLVGTDNRPNRDSATQRYSILPNDGLPLIFHYYRNGAILSYNSSLLGTCEIKDIGKDGFKYAVVDHKAACSELTVPELGLLTPIADVTSAGAARNGAFGRLLLLAEKTAEAGAHRLHRLLLCLHAVSHTGGVCIGDDVAVIGEYSFWMAMLWRVDAFAGARENMPGVPGDSVLGFRHDTELLATIRSGAETILHDVLHKTSTAELLRMEEKLVAHILKPFQQACQAPRCRVFHSELVYPRPRQIQLQPFYLRVHWGRHALTSPLPGTFQTAPYGEIPKIFHVIWFGQCSNLSLRKYESIMSWLRYHPDWELKFWTEDDLRAEKLTLQSAIDTAKSYAQKSDIARVEIVARYGGIYVDSDLECLENIDPLIKGASAVGCHEDGVEQVALSLSTGFFGATPNHPVAQRLVTAYGRALLNTKDVNMKTGPAFFRAVIGEDLDMIRMLPSRWFYPIRYSERNLLTEHGCHDIGCRFFGSYAIHYFKAVGAIWEHAAPISHDADSCTAFKAQLKSRHKVVSLG
eukprot:m.140243 g.140243  ORF g.140243 m.140243 type:complete len:780 (-) comp15959_c3_seq2:432-2771(-)